MLGVGPSRFSGVGNRATDRGVQGVMIRHHAIRVHHVCRSPMRSVVEEHGMNSKVTGVILAGLISVVFAGAETFSSSPDASNFEEFRVIFKRNMFSSRRGLPEQKDEKVERGQQQIQVAARANIKVVGIVRRDNSLSSIAILEENGRHRMCRVGDTVGAMTILDIRSRGIVFGDPAGQWVAEIQPSGPSRRTVLTQGAAVTADAIGGGRAAPDPSGRRVPIHKTQVSDLARSAKFVAAMEGGTTKGLRLTQDFNFLREGDLVTYVGRQSLCTSQPKQKLWQIARKYAACHGEMPEIQVGIERGGIELQFVLCPYS